MNSNYKELITKTDTADNKTLEKDIIAINLLSFLIVNQYAIYANDDDKVLTALQWYRQREPTFSVPPYVDESNTDILWCYKLAKVSNLLTEPTLRELASVLKIINDSQERWNNDKDIDKAYIVFKRIGNLVQLLSKELIIKTPPLSTLVSVPVQGIRTYSMTRYDALRELYNFALQPFYKPYTKDLRIFLTKADVANIIKQSYTKTNAPTLAKDLIGKDTNGFYRFSSNVVDKSK